MRIVVCERHDKASDLLLDGFARVTGDDDHFVNARPAQRDQLSIDERHALQSNEGLDDATHAPALAGRQQDGANAQSRVKSPALLEQASHGSNPLSSSSLLYVQNGKACADYWHANLERLARGRECAGDRAGPH